MFMLLEDGKIMSAGDILHKGYYFINNAWKHVKWVIAYIIISRIIYMFEEMLINKE